MGKKGFLAGLLFGATAAAAGYAYYKSLSPEEQAKLKNKVDDVVVDVRDRAVDYTYAATDAVAGVRDRADEFVAENGFSDKLADLKDQAMAKADELKAAAQDKTAGLRDKANDLKDQVRDKVAPELAEADIDDIVLDPEAPSLSEALADTYEDVEEPVAVEEAKPVVLEPEGGLSETDKPGLSEQ